MKIALKFRYSLPLTVVLLISPHLAAVSQGVDIVAIDVIAVAHGHRVSKLLGLVTAAFVGGVQLCMEKGERRDLTLLNEKTGRKELPTGRHWIVLPTIAEPGLSTLAVLMAATSNCQ
jgi:hypothetical protein